MIQGIIARLLETPAVTALVGSRISPGRRPQAGPLPDIVLHIISGAPVYTDQGEAGLQENRIQIDCWALTYIAAKQVGEAVKSALSAYVGTAGGVTFQFVLLSAERDFNEPGSNVAEYFFRTSLDFIVWSEL